MSSPYIGCSIVGRDRQCMCLHMKETAAIRFLGQQNSRAEDNNANSNYLSCEHDHYYVNIPTSKDIIPEAAHTNTAQVPTCLYKQYRATTTCGVRTVQNPSSSAAIAIAGLQELRTARSIPPRVRAREQTSQRRRNTARNL